MICETYSTYLSLGLDLTLHFSRRQFMIAAVRFEGILGYQYQRIALPLLVLTVPYGIQLLRHIVFRGYPPSDWYGGKLDHGVRLGCLLG